MVKIIMHTESTTKLNEHTIGTKNKVISMCDSVSELLQSAPESSESKYSGTAVQEEWRSWEDMENSERNCTRRFLRCYDPSNRDVQLSTFVSGERWIRIYTRQRRRDRDTVSRCGFKTVEGHKYSQLRTSV